MKFWKGLSLKQKSILSLGIVLTLMVSSVVFTFISTNKVSQDFESIIHGDIVFRADLSKLKSGMLMARRHEKDFLLREDEKYLKRHKDTIATLDSLLIKMSKNGNMLSKENEDSLRTSLSQYSQGFEKVVQNISSEGGSNSGIRGDIRGTAHGIEKAISKYNLGPLVTVELLMLRRHEKDYLLRRTEKYLNKVNSRLDKLVSTVKSLNGFDNDKAIAAISGLANQYRTQFKSLYDNYNTRLEIISSFRSSIHTIEKISDDYIQKVSVTVEKRLLDMLALKKDTAMTNFFVSVGGVLVLVFVAFYYVNLAGELRSISSLLKTTSVKTLDISENLRTNASKLSSSVAQESAAVIQTVSTLDELKEMMKRSVDNANFSETKSNESHTIATDGKTAVAEVVNAINEISECNVNITNQMETTSKEFTEIVDVIKEISNKTDVINDIVFQTKLLSFNASVEAARAGEHGKGFAVVAEEVGNLAQMSGKAAKEIEDMIISSISKVDTIVSSSNQNVGKLVETAKNKTEYGVTTAKKCNTVLDQVVSNVAHVKDLMKEISSAAAEQATGIQNISEAMSELDQSTHMNSSIASTTSDSSENINHEAGSLKGIVTRLETIVSGTHENSKSLKVSKEKKGIPDTNKDVIDDVKKAS